MGVGTRLIRDALERAEEADEPAVMVEGIASYGRIVYRAAFEVLGC